MGIENYKAWVPTENLTTQLYFLGLQNESGALTILLKNFEDQSKLLRIRFDGTLAYRVTQEAGRLKTINENDPLATFNVITDSPFLRWFEEESEGIFDDWSLMHIVVCNSDNIIDVITNQKPEVKWEDS